MTIFIKNVEWTQNESEVIIKIPFKLNKSSCDIIIWEKFLKINIKPYFYEVFFEFPIIVEQSTYKFLETCIKCVLKKAQSEWWTCLGKYSKAETDNKVISRELKEEILREYEASVEQEYKNKKVEQYKLKRFETDKEVQRQQAIREKIENIEKNLLKENASSVKSNFSIELISFQLNNFWYSNRRRKTSRKILLWIQWLERFLYHRVNRKNLTL